MVVYNNAMGRLDYTRTPFERMKMGSVKMPQTKSLLTNNRQGPMVGDSPNDPSKAAAGTTFGSAMPGVGYVANQRRGLHR